MMTKKAIFLSIVIITAITMVFIGSNQEDKPTTIRVAALQGPTSIGMIKMIEDEPDILGIPSSYEIIKSTDLIISKLQTNEFDIACLPVNLAANAYNKDIQYQLLGVNTLNNIYILGNDSNIQNLNNLKGSTIGMINKGATPDVLFNYIMDKNNIDITNDISIDYSMPPAELAGAITANKIKYAVLPEPFVSQVISKNSNVSILFDFQKELDKVTDEKIDITQGCVIVNKEFAINNKEIVEEFINKYIESITFVNDNPIEAGTMSEKYSLGVNASTAETAIPRTNIVYISASEAKNDVNKFLTILYNFSPKSIGDKLPDDDFYYTK